MSSPLRYPMPELDDALHYADRLMYHVKTNATGGFVIKGIRFGIKEYDSGWKAADEAPICADASNS